MKRPDTDRLILTMNATLTQVADRKTNGFSGMGLVVYNSGVLPEETRCCLRPGIVCPKGLTLGSPELADYLFTISANAHKLHDGFHFANEDGILTHVAQYFVPAVVPGKKPHKAHGVRFFSALCGSLMGGVLMTGVVCSNGKTYLFRNGETIHEPV
jgi:hypothetical protein